MLDNIKTEAFHHVVSKLLYVSKPARVNIELEISYLCMIVSYSIIIIGACGLEIIQTWVDASYIINWDMQGHTGELI